MVLSFFFLNMSYLILIITKYTLLYNSLLLYLKSKKIAKHIPTYLPIYRIHAYSCKISYIMKTLSFIIHITQNIQKKKIENMV